MGITKYIFYMTDLTDQFLLKKLNKDNGVIIILSKVKLCLSCHDP